MADRNYSESMLVQRAQSGDSSAFERLFVDYQGRIYALCLRMTSDPGRAEDLTQEAFIRAWERLGSFRGQSGFFTWLYRLAVNVVLADLRARGRWHDRLVAGDDTLLEQPAASSRSSLHAIALERALAALPPQARLIFLLHDVEGYRHREIAAITEIAEGTSKAHLHNARKLLRKALNG